MYKIQVTKKIKRFFRNWRKLVEAETILHFNIVMCRKTVRNSPLSWRGTEVQCRSRAASAFKFSLTLLLSHHCDGRWAQPTNTRNLNSFLFSLWIARSLRAHVMSEKEEKTTWIIFFFLVARRSRACCTCDECEKKILFLMFCMQLSLSAARTMEQNIVHFLCMFQCRVLFLDGNGIFGRICTLFTIKDDWFT